MLNQNELVTEGLSKRPHYAGGGRLATKCRTAAIVAGALAAVCLSAPAQAEELFDWTRIGNITAPEKPGINRLLEIGNGLDSDVLDYLIAKDMGGGPVGVVVRQDLTPAAASFWFDGVGVDYVFADYEAVSGVGTTVDRTAALAAQLVGTASSAASVGNYGFDSFEDTVTTTGADGFVTAADYAAAGVNMSNASQYPGGSAFKTPSAQGLGGTSSAPTVRATLFTLPIIRNSGVSASLPSGHLNIPYITDFNNFGSTVFDNTTLAPYDFVFDSSLLADPDNLLAGKDMAAMSAHNRMRGADSQVLFFHGHLGKTQGALEDAVLGGWKELDDAFDYVAMGGSSPVVETLSTEIRINDGVSYVDTDFEDAGAAVSVVVNGDKAWVLWSNLSDSKYKVELPDTIGGKSFVSDSERRARLRPNDHLLVEYGLFLDEWFVTGLSTNPFAFADSDRSGIGVPEPSSSAVLALAGLLIGWNRPSTRRRKVAG